MFVIAPVLLKRRFFCIVALSCVKIDNRIGDDIEDINDANNDAVVSPQVKCLYLFFS